MVTYNWQASGLARNGHRFVGGSMGAFNPLSGKSITTGSRLVYKQNM